MQVRKNDGSSRSIRHSFIYKNTAWRNSMNPLSEKIDKLEFSWDRESVDSKKTKEVHKITSITRCDLEEYFIFLEDVLPDPSISNKKQLPIDKVFEL